MEVLRKMELKDKINQVINKYFLKDNNDNGMELNIILQDNKYYLGIMKGNYDDNVTVSTLIESFSYNTLLEEDDLGLLITELLKDYSLDVKSFDKSEIVLAFKLISNIYKPEYIKLNIVSRSSENNLIKPYLFFLIKNYYNELIKTPYIKAIIRNYNEDLYRERINNMSKEELINLASSLNETVLRKAFDRLKYNEINNYEERDLTLILGLQ